LIAKLWALLLLNIPHYIPFSRRSAHMKAERAPTVLVIDDDRSVAEQVRLAAPEWEIHATYDGVAGIAFVRAHWDKLNLVVLDVRMPHDGVMVCAQIGAEAKVRAAAPRFLILPYTAADDTGELLAELGCAPTLLKPAARDLLRLRMQQALGLPPTPPPASAFLHYLQGLAIRSERELAEQRQATAQVAILASSGLLRIALREAFATAGSIVRVDSTSADALRPMLAQWRVAALVADSGAQSAAAALASEFRLPLLVVALTLTAAYRALDNVAGVVVDGNIPQTIAAALAAVSAGERYRDPALDVPFASSGLTRQEQELVRLLVRGWSTDAIAKQLKFQPQTVREYRSRIYGKLAVSDLDQLREWMDSQVGRRS
jgi:DNA-binding NarL/FixJ family response regulator